MALRILFADKQRLKSTRKDILFVSLSFFAMFVVGLLWSSDLSEAFKQLKKALSFLVVPIYFFAVPPQSRQNLLRLVGLALLGSVVLSLWALIRLYFFDYEDIRTALPTSSHIRFALIVCCEIGFLAIYILRNHSEISKLSLRLSYCLIVYFVAYLLLSASMTGIAILLLVVLPICIIEARKQISKRAFYFSASSVTLAFLFFVFVVLFYANEYFTPKNGEKQDCLIENGYYLYCSETSDLQQERTELQNGLEKYLDITTDNASLPYFDIAYRYLNSKGLPINEHGLQSLSQKDMDNIKNGIPNHVYAEANPLKARLYKTFFEFEAYEHWNKVEGSSLIQRLELWHKSILLVDRTERFVFGVGTGDLKGELNRKLQASDSQLFDSGIETSNQFIRIFATFGLLGFLVFCVFIFYPMFATNLYHNAYYICFLAIMLLSMVTEDTLTTLEGRMFFCLLNSFFLAWASPCSKKVLPLQR